MEGQSRKLRLMDVWWVLAAVAVIAYFFQAVFRGTDASVDARATLEVLGLERILVVQLDGVARGHELAANAKKLRVPIQVLNATNGHTDDKWLSFVLPSLSLNSTCADVIGAIFDSHERAWIIASTGLRPMLVLEDDVELGHDFKELLMQRMEALPKGFHLAFAGTSVSSKVDRLSRLLSKPDAAEPNHQGILGFWGYVVSPEGARLLLHLAAMARHDPSMPSGKRRIFQPVDLFVSHRLDLLDVYVFEAPPALATWFENYPDLHHVLPSHRQVGIVVLRGRPSTNMPQQESNESIEMSALVTKASRMGEENRAYESWRASRKALKIVRHYPCWHTQTHLQNAGLALLRMLINSRAMTEGKANATFLLALEALASSARYSEGSWQGPRKLSDYHMWVQQTLAARREKHLSALSIPDQPIILASGHRLEAWAFNLKEPLRVDHKVHVGSFAEG